MQNGSNQTGDGVIGDVLGFLLLKGDEEKHFPFLKGFVLQR